MQNKGLMFGILFVSLILLASMSMVIAQNNSGSGSNDSDDNDSNDDDSDISVNASVNVTVNSEDEKDDDDSDDVNEADDNETDRNRTRNRIEIREDGDIRIISKQIIAGASGCVIKMEKRIRIEDGRRVEEIKRRIECENGFRQDINIKIDNRTVDGRIREKFRYETNESNITVEAEDEIEFEEETNATHYRLKARLRNGNITDIKIMPDTASEVALERLRLKVCSEDNNCSIQLRERIHNNVPRVVYNIEANQNGRFLGIFRIAMRANAEVDPETGELLDVNRPWWAFLVAQTDDTETLTDEGNQTDTNQTNNETGTFPTGTVNESSNDSENAAA
ncbi:MAG: hypothetical protein WD876_03540 [Candidatus Pacearchaeota archaeon]